MPDAAAAKPVGAATATKATDKLRGHERQTGFLVEQIAARIEDSVTRAIYIASK